MLFLFALLSFLDPPSSLKPMEYLVFPDRDGFSIVTTDSVYFTTDGDYFERRKHFFAEQIFRMEGVPTTGQTQFFVATGGGVVYKYERDTLTRIDQSYRWRSRYGASLYATNDQIYSFGGYGEFTFYNDLLKFSEINREWIEIPVYEPRPHRKSNTLMYLDTINSSVYIALGSDSYYDRNKKSTYRPFYDIGKFDLTEERYEVVGDLSDLKTIIDSNQNKFWNRFQHYHFPILYSNRHLYSFDFTDLKMFEHIDANFPIIEQYSNILAYNKTSNTFLLASDLPAGPKFHIINESDLLGRHYVEYNIGITPIFPPALYGLIVLVLITIITFLLSRKKIVLIELIQQNRKKVKALLSDEDYVVLEKIIESYPNTVDYPDLQNSFERDLSYESRIKKLRTTIKTIDERIQEVLKLRRSVFVIEKGKEDKRVKVIRIKDETIKRSKLRSIWPF